MNIDENNKQMMKFDENVWKHIKINKIGWAFMKLDENRRKSKKFDEVRCNWWKCVWNIWKSMKFHENLRKSMKLDDILWKYVRIDDIRWQSMKIDEIRWTLIKNALGFREGVAVIRGGGLSGVKPSRAEWSRARPSGAEARSWNPRRCAHASGTVPASC